MRQIDLATAVSEIYGAVEGDQTPFFMFAGAGISAPEVILATEVERHCRERASTSGSDPSIDGKSDLERYSYWFERAYPHSVQRQRYLQSLMQGKPISAANLRLAHLLMEGRIAKTVLTPNFDLALTEALTIFGADFTVCDHPGTAARIDPEHDTVQVVHVHGTFWFYDCCNLTGEIDARAGAVPGSGAMPSLIDRVLSRRSPLVLGYSGWEADVFMTSLRRRLADRLPYKLYWFCYEREAVSHLPDWLTQHQDVALVLPEGPVDEIPTKPDRKALDDTKPARLTAVEVLEALIQAGDLQAPPLTRDPVRYWADMLRRRLPQADDSDLYQLEEVLARIERAAECEGVGTPVTQPMDLIRDASRRSDPAEILENAGLVELDHTDSDDLIFLSRSVTWAMSSLYPEGAGVPISYLELWLEIETAIVGQLRRRKPQPWKDLCQAMVRRAAVQHLLKETSGALRQLTTAERQLQRAALGELDTADVHIPLLELRARIFAERGEWPKLRAVASDMANMFNGSKHDRAIAKALLGFATRLDRAGEHTYEIDIYRHVINAYKAGARNVALFAARASFNLALTLRQEGHSSEARAALLELEDMFSHTDDASIGEIVVESIMVQGVQRLDDDEFDEALLLFERALATARRTPIRNKDVRIAQIRVNQGATLSMLNRSHEALDIYDDIVKLAGAAGSSPEMQQAVLRAKLAGATVLAEMGDLEGARSRLRRLDPVLAHELPEDLRAVVQELKGLLGEAQPEPL